MQSQKYLVAVVGAGPAGLFASRELALNGVSVCLFNRDVKPGGLAEYGIYPEKYKMKYGLRNQFSQILALGPIDYYGNVRIDTEGPLTLDKLREMGFQAILVTIGAQGTKWLGLPGEQLKGVFHAKDLVYHYNLLPPFSRREFKIGKDVAIIGVGNVMTDIARYLIRHRHVDSVTAIARRGPAEIKFDRQELDYIAANLNEKELDEEIDRAAEWMLQIGQDPEKPREIFHNALSRAEKTENHTHVSLRFLLSPSQILDDGNGNVAGLEVEKNTLVADKGATRAIGTGQKTVLDVDTVIFAIGDSVDGKIGLPVQRGEYAKNPQPRFPMDGQSYEVFDPAAGRPVEGLFVAGWSRNASTGVVGIARRDGINGAKAVLQYLQGQPQMSAMPLSEIRSFIEQNYQAVSKEHLAILESVEKERAREKALEDFKFDSNEEMLAVIKQLA